MVQSSFQSPCDPLPGGFSSGIAGVGNASQAAEVAPPTWDLLITNDTQRKLFLNGDQLRY